MALTWCGVQETGDGTWWQFPPLGRSERSDLCILGVPYDGGRSAAGGQAEAPFAIRRLEYFDSWQDNELGDLSTVKMVDAGDLTIDHRSPIRSLAKERSSIKKLWNNTGLLLAVGGDHSITDWLLDVHMVATNDPLNVVHLDAHSDTWPVDDTGNASHDSWVTAARSAGNYRRLWQFGIRAMGPDTLKDDLTSGLVTTRKGDFYAADIHHFVQTYKFAHGTQPLYLTVDMDVVDPAFCPGVAYPEPGGWTPRELLKTIETIVAELPVIGVDIVEITPALDSREMSVRLAHRSVLAVVKGLKRRSLIQST